MDWLQPEEAAEGERKSIMAVPADYKFAATHEWAKVDGDTATIGISDFAQNELGDLVFINLPEVGDSVTAGEAFADVESVKAVSDIFSPLSGNVVEVNDAAIDDPSQINADPWGTWLIKVDGISGADDLMDAAAYEATL